MKKAAFAGVLFVLLGASLPTSPLFAQGIESEVPRSVVDFFEQACSPELAAMNASWAAVGMNGVLQYAYYQKISRMTEDEIREQFRQSDGIGPGAIARRDDTDQYRATNVWEDCLLNARLRQLGAAPVARPPQPAPPEPPATPPATPPNADQTDNEPAPDPGAPAQLITDDEGRERYVMPDGRDCVVIQTGQERVSNGNFNQVVTAKNRCNIPITVRACAPDGTCMDMVAPANATASQVVGTSTSPISDFKVTKLEDMGDDGQFGPGPNPAPVYQGGNSDLTDNTPIDFGDDSSPWAGNGECDDSRFSGVGAASEMRDEDRFADASDCEALLAAGQIEFVGYSNNNGIDQASGIDFGDDSGNWPRDGECDDPRFSGAGAASQPQDDQVFRDAYDCRVLLGAGQIDFTGYTDRSPPSPAPDNNSSIDQTSGIDFGNDQGPYAHDNECDDPRFSGSGASGAPLERDLFHDASDCRQAFAAGDIEFTGYTDRGNSTDQSNNDGIDVDGFLDTLNRAVGTIGAVNDLLNAVNGVNQNDESSPIDDSGDSDSGDGGDDEEEEDDSCGCSGGICTCQ